MTKLRMRQAVVHALADELECDPTVILLGEDIGAAGGAFKATEGLQERFGERRVRDTPISEMGFLGASVGAAATGLRPVVEMMFVEFIGVALDQLTTQAASFRYLSRGSYAMPLTLRAAVGGGLGFGCQHSQILDHWFRGTPGIHVVMPSTPQAAYGLLRAAIRSDDPVVVLEHKALYGERGEVELGDAGIIPLGRAATVTTGTDVTIVGLGRTVHTAVAAAAGANWTADIIDLQTIKPWDRACVLESVSKTRRLVTVEENSAPAGWGADIVDTVVGELWGNLSAPPHRITAPHIPIPYAQSLEDRYIPNAIYVHEQVTTLLDTGRRPAPWWEGRV
ncbi:alpha-ketoacid dehydrogenase subunit beta [Gemmatimonas sp.]|uniref:alpha-ketoacid dehydrogenase subunit beta n=1 Tax=Gemmatimonas sp. TaxID=1962908 RepID=UPI00356AD9E6